MINWYRNVDIGEPTVDTGSRYYDIINDVELYDISYNLQDTGSVEILSDTNSCVISMLAKTAHLWASFEDSNLQL